MARIIDSGDDSVHLESRDSIWLTIGVGMRRHASQGKNRHTLLSAVQARILAYALLSEAERLDERKNSN
jgi:hypothetical protein